VAVVGATAVLATEPLQHQRHQVPNVPKTPAAAAVHTPASIQQIRKSFSVPQHRVSPAGHVVQPRPAALRASVHSKAARSSVPPFARGSAAPGRRVKTSKTHRSHTTAKASIKQSTPRRSGHHGRQAGTGKPSATPPVQATQPVPATAAAPGANGNGGQGHGKG
jgi:hypothetical protein